MAVSSTPSNSPIDVCSRALILIGAEPIASFGDNTNEALVATNMYEDIARSALVNSRWRFATLFKCLFNDLWKILKKIK